MSICIYDAHEYIYINICMYAYICICDSYDACNGHWVGKTGIFGMVMDGLCVNDT